MAAGRRFYGPELQRYLAAGRGARPAMSSHDDFENRPKMGNRSASSPAGRDPQISRPDWSLFRSLNTLPQKAGVPVNKLWRLCLKELVDNSLEELAPLVWTAPRGS